MRIGHTRPCPLCAGPALYRQLPGGQPYTRLACPRCGSFRLEPTLPLSPWDGVAPAEALLLAFLPVYIHLQNRRHRAPLVTLGNWRALARRGCIVALRGPGLRPNGLSCPPGLPPPW